MDEKPTEQPAPTARIVSDKVREKLVPLEYPVEFDGQTYDVIKVRRVSGQQMAAFLDKVRSGADFVLAPMVDCPVEVWDALDADDQAAVDEAAREFLPRRLIDLQKVAATIDAG
jgi:hypothetical protein